MTINIEWLSEIRAEDIGEKGEKISKIPPKIMIEVW